MTRPILLLDCYIDDPGARDTFGALVDPDRMSVVRATRESVQVQLEDFAGVIISGSAASIVDPPAWAARLEQLVHAAVEGDVPMLGVCFGHQIIARALYGSGVVRASARSELGWMALERSGNDPLLRGVPEHFRVFCSHVEEVANVPDEVHVLARSEDCAVHAFRIRDRRLWGVQFHAEMSLAEARQLVRDKASRYPERGIDVNATLAHARDTAGLAQTVVDNFLAQIDCPPARR